jgi:hypothetical protein
MPPKATTDLAGDGPHATVKGKIGSINAGLYCGKCAEFIALAVIRDDRPISEVEYKSDGQILLDCWQCGSRQARQAQEIQHVRLSGRNLRIIP